MTDEVERAGLPAADYQAEPGDIFACWGTDAVSRFISIETSLLTWQFAPPRLRLSPSHVAMAVSSGLRRECHWVESTTLARRTCLVRGERVSGCQVHHIEHRISDYLATGGRVHVYRLTPINRLSLDEMNDMRRDMVDWFVKQGIGYDAASAIFSGTRLIRLADKVLPFWESRSCSVFCSQLLAAELQSLGRMNRDDPERYNPGRLLRVLVRTGVYAFHTSFEATA